MTDTSKRTNEEIVQEIADSIHEADHRMLDKMTSKGKYWLETYDGEGVEKAIKRVAMEALNTKDRERDEAVAEAVNATLKNLGAWIDDNVGTSSQAIYLYMSSGVVPSPSDAPWDASDRGRCEVLLKAIPQWIPRLKELEEMELKVTVSTLGQSGRTVRYLWREQMRLIRDALTIPQEAITTPSHKEHERR